MTKITMKRYKFNSSNQKEKKGIGQYVAEFRKLATRCDYEHITPEEIMRDRDILG